MGEVATKSEAQSYPVNIVCVNAAGMWSEGHASYLGRSVGLLYFFRASDIERCCYDRQKSAEVILARRTIE